MRKTVTFAFSIFCLMAALQAHAYDFEVDGIYYNVVSSSDLTCEVTSGSTEYSGEVVIPEAVDYNGKALTVTRIGSEAFRCCYSLTEVTIPNSVTSIRISAFEFCSSLTEVTIPNSVTSIGDYAFAECSSLTEVTIPNSVTSIGNSAFTCCTSLTEVTIPNSVTSIGSCAFDECYSLTEVTIPNSVTSIGNYAFAVCTSLTEVTIGNSVTSIGDCAFYECTSLTEVTIPNSVTSIGNSAFAECTSLTEVTIGNSVTSIGDYAFSDTKVTSLKFEDGTKTLDLDEYTFNGCNITELYIGRNVSSDYDLSWWLTDGLKTLTIGSQLTTWSSYYYGDNLETVNSMIEDPAQLTPSFSNKVYINATLYVPTGTKEAYTVADGWKDFFNIQEKDFSTGIATTAVYDNTATEVSRYNASGQAISSPRKGLNIVRMSDGTTKKVVVR